VVGLPIVVVVKGAAGCVADRHYMGWIGVVAETWKDWMMIFLDAAVADDKERDHATGSTACWLVEAEIALGFAGAADKEEDSSVGGADDSAEAQDLAELRRRRTQTLVKKTA
jgi:hypothetical protein